MASGAYTHTHTHTLADESDYKKPGAPACGRRAWFKKQSLNLIQIKQTWHHSTPHELLYSMPPVENLSSLWLCNYDAF